MKRKEEFIIKEIHCRISKNTGGVSECFSWLTDARLKPSAQVMMRGSWNRVPCRAQCSVGSLLEDVSLSPSAHLPTCDLFL